VGVREGKLALSVSSLIRGRLSYEMDEELS
jgi:hypothetical protein